MDEELFELCKEVYEKTGWDTDDKYLCYEWDVNGYRTGEKSVEHKSMIDFEEMGKHVIHPLYTSDYLLEKLPLTIENDIDEEPKTYWISIEPITEDPNKWAAGYRHRGFGIIFEQWEGTPLKALLTLTLALHEAGELAAIMQTVVKSLVKPATKDEMGFKGPKK